MKKALIVAVVLLVLVIAIVIGIKVIVFPPEMAITKILPEEVSFYYSVQHLESIWEVVKTSNFWRDFSQLKLWKDIKIQARLKDIQNHFRENAGIELTETNFLKLAGRELAIAIVPQKSLAHSPDILLFAKGKDRQSFLNIVNPAMENIKRKKSTLIEDIQYKGKEIIHIKSAAEGQPDTYFTLLRNVLIVGIGKTPASLKRVIDISKGEEKKSLAVSEKCKKLLSFIGIRRNVASVFLLDFAEMQRHFERFPGIPGYNMFTAHPLGNTPGISYIGGWTEIKNEVVTRIYVYPPKDHFNPEMKPKILETLRFIPEKVLLYIGYGTLDASNMWNVWMKNLHAQAESYEKTKRILTGIESFEKDWDISITNNILPLLGEIGGWTEIKKGLVTKLCIYPQKEHFTAEMEQIWETKPKVLEIFRFAPEKVLLYIAYGTLDASNSWNVWMENLRAQAESYEKGKRILTGIEDFEKDWDISITNNILPLLGEEIAFLFSDISIKAFMPAPKLGIALKVTDKVKMEDLINYLVKKNNEKAEIAAEKRKEKMEMLNTLEKVQEWMKDMEWLMKKTDEMPEIREIVKKLEAKETSEQLAILENMKDWEKTPEKREIMEKLKDYVKRTERIKGQEEMIKKMEDYKFEAPSFMFGKIDLTEETYNGYAIKALQIPVEGLDIVPGYVFIDNFLLIGSSNEFLREMIDVKNGKIKALTQDNAYKQLADILPSKNNQRSFVNMELLVDIGIRISEWIASFWELAMRRETLPKNPEELELFNQQKLQIETSIAVIREYVIPILKILKSIKIITAASIKKQDYIEYTLVLKAEDIQ